MTRALRVSVTHSPVPRRVRERPPASRWTRTTPSSARRSRARGSRSGSACATTSTSTASARRSAGSTSAAGSSAATRTRCGTATPTATTRRTDPHLRLGPVLHGAARRARPRHLPRQHASAARSTSATSRRGCSRSGREGGELDYYFIDGPAPKHVIERYTALTGRMPLPPRWALGYHQCRYSYYPESKVRFIARQLPRAADPGRRDLARHPLPGRLQARSPGTASASPTRSGCVSDLRAQGFRVVTIVDPHPKKEPGSLRLRRAGSPATTS